MGLLRSGLPNEAAADRERAAVAVAGRAGLSATPASANRKSHCAQPDGAPAGCADSWALGYSTAQERAQAAVGPRCGASCPLRHAAGWVAQGMLMRGHRRRRFCSCGPLPLGCLWLLRCWRCSTHCAAGPAKRGARSGAAKQRACATPAAGSAGPAGCTSRRALADLRGLLPLRCAVVTVRCQPGAVSAPHRRGAPGAPPLRPAPAPGRQTGVTGADRGHRHRRLLARHIRGCPWSARAAQQRAEGG